MVLHLRQRNVVEYLTGLEAASHATWAQLATTSTTTPVRLLLCHPAWLNDPEHLVGLGLYPFRGTATSVDCSAMELWGYQCPLTSEQIEADHLFPLSLGGPAVGTNQVWLCRVHNQWKGANLMDFPWERDEPAWLSEQIDRMSRLVDGSSVI